MKTLLVCPGGRPAVGDLNSNAPLATVPFLGQSLLEYWLTALAASGTRQVLILADDRPEQVQGVVGDGARWGLEATVVAESRELSLAQALLKYSGELDPIPPQNALAVIDHFPGSPELPLFGSYAEFFAGIRAWLPQAFTAERVGMREARPGVWVGSHAHVAADARLEAPCWVGNHTYIGKGASVGKDTVIEDGAFLEPGAEVNNCWVGPDTFMGRMARISKSLVWGNSLTNWETGSTVKVADPFLLCALRGPRRQRSANWLARLGEMYARNKDEAYLLWKHLLLHKEG